MILGDFVCYIDEAGDDGIETGGTEWFILSGMMLRKENEPALKKAVEDLKTLLDIKRGKPLHWRKLRHLEKTTVATKLASHPIRVVNVAVCKDRLEDAIGLRQKFHLYFWAVRLLVERVSWYVANKGEMVHLIFSNRSQFPYKRLESYLELVQALPEAQIRPAIASLSSKPHSKVLSLQAANACAGAVFNALEADHHGEYKPAYLQILLPTFYRHGGKVLSYGLKLFPYKLADRTEYTNRYSWLQQL